MKNLQDFKPYHLVSENDSFENLGQPFTGDRLRTSQLSSAVQNALEKHWVWVDINYHSNTGTSQTQAASSQDGLQSATAFSNSAYHLAKIAFENASEGMMVMDANANILSINKSFTAITGFNQQEVFGTVPKAVSYTHLDVYKRQQYMILDIRMNKRILSFIRDTQILLCGEL